MASTLFIYLFVFATKKTLNLRFYVSVAVLQQGRQLKNEVILLQPNVLMHTPDVLHSYFLQPFDLWRGNINQ